MTLDLEEEALDLAKIRYQCRRGMLELDLVLSRFLDKGFNTLTKEEQLNFATLLDFPDQDLYEFLMGRASPEPLSLQLIIHKLRSI